MRCEDFPCCGHELGCCPDFDESGRQLNMKCTCGATVPLNSSSSLCGPCLRSPDPDDPYGWDGDEEDFGEEEEEEDYEDEGVYDDYEGYYESVYETDARW